MTTLIEPTRVEVIPGQEYTAEMPFSEVCMHMRVAGKRMRFVLLDSRRGVQLLTDSGSHFSFPITVGEAGIYEQDGTFYRYA